MADKVVIEELLETEPSDSSEEELMLAVFTGKSNIPKIKDFLDVVHNFQEKEFKGNFRISSATASTIIAGFENSAFWPRNRSRGGSIPIDAEKHILLFLWFAGNKCCLRDVAQRFNVGQTTTFRIINRVMNYLCDIAPSIIKFPTTADEKQAEADRFEQISGFPSVLGCIDGTYINIGTPAHKIKSTYVNRHDIPAVVLQGICDHQRRFVDVFTGDPGKIHDGRVHTLLFISEKLPGLCKSDGEMKYHILGDAAYSIREWLLTPYRDYGNLTERQRNYNNKFSATRVLVENCFGMLKSRMRQLLILDIHSVEKISKFIIACCVIHNICINLHDDMEFEIVEEANNVYEEPGGELKRRGEIKRDLLSHHLVDIR